MRTQMGIEPGAHIQAGVSITAYPLRVIKTLEYIISSHHIASPYGCDNDMRADKK